MSENPSGKNVLEQKNTDGKITGWKSLRIEPDLTDATNKADNCQIKLEFIQLMTSKALEHIAPRLYLVEY
ncbi:MAG: hypothetical protein WDA24_11950 [Tissierellales bacterium]